MNEQKAKHTIRSALLIGWMSTMALADLEQNKMMAHLIASLKAKKDIGHYGRLVFVMVARHFLDEKEMIKLLTEDPDCSSDKARLLIHQVNARGYNPPKPQRILEWMDQQEFDICPSPDDANAVCNVYRDLQFPEELYNKISSYYEHEEAGQATR